MGLEHAFVDLRRYYRISHGQDTAFTDDTR